MKRTSLQLGSVYRYKNSYPVYIKSIVQVDGRTAYEIIRVKSNGELGASTIVYYRKANFKLIRNAEVRIAVVIHKPRSTNDDFQGIVDSCIDIMKKAKNKEIAAQDARNKLGFFMFNVVGLVDEETGKNYTIQDLAKALELRRYRKAYRWMISCVKSRISMNGTSKMADRTLVATYHNWKQYWGSLYGFYSELDEYMVAEMSKITK